MLFVFILFLFSSFQVQASPNIILIIADDLGWSQTSVVMDPRLNIKTNTDYIETPNIKRLAESGMVFSSGYSPASICTPTRRSILCGTSTVRSGCCFGGNWVPSEHLTIPNALKNINSTYQTAHYGKWGAQMNNSPEECGYDDSDGETTNFDGDDVSKSKKTKWIIKNLDPKKTFSITEKAIKFITNHTSTQTPFYLQLSYYANHLSVTCSQCVFEKYVLKGVPDRSYTHCFSAMTEDLDMGIGNILDTLEFLDIMDNTYVFFTSDNGGRKIIPGGNRTKIPTNFPLMGAKHSPYEGGLRVPFIVKGPGIKKKSFCHKPVVGYDLLPTFEEIAGGSTSNSTEVDGISIFPLLLSDYDKKTFDRGIFFDIKHDRSAIRKGQYKLVIKWKNGIANRELWKVNKNPIESNERKITNIIKSDELQTLLLNHYNFVKLY